MLIYHCGASKNNTAIRALSILLLALTAMSNVTIKPVHAQNLQEFLQTAYDTHPVLKSHLRQALRNYEGAYGAVAERFLPRLDYQYSHQYARIDPKAGSTYDPLSLTPAQQATLSPELQIAYRNRIRGFSYYNKSTTARLSLQQNLFRSFQDYHELHRFLNTAEMAKLDYHGSEQDFLSTAIDVYLATIRTERIVNLRRANRQALQERYDVVLRLYEVNDATETDLQQSIARLANANAELRNAESQYQQALASFRDLGNGEPNQLQIPDLPDNLPESQEQGESLVNQNNFAIRSAEAAQKATKSAYKQVLASTGISVDLNLSYQRRENSRATRGGLQASVQDPFASLTDENTTTTGIILSLPLYDPAASSRIRNAYQALLFANDGYAARKRENIRQFRSQWAQHKSAIERTQYLAEATIAAEKSVQNVIQQQRAGLRLIVDVLDEQTRLVNAQVAYQQARFDQLSSAYQILLENGRLTAAKLGLNNLYDQQIDSYYKHQKAWGSLPGLYTLGKQLNK